MSVVYEDKYLVCDDQALTIKEYFFPFGSKRIPYASLKKVSAEDMNFLSGAWRIWGMGLSPHWFHLDWERPQKKECIVLDTGEWIKSVITPADHQAVLEILRDKTKV